MAKKKTSKKSAKPVPFELSLEKLRDVVGLLETGNLTLSESLDKYEQGVASLKSCYEALNQAQSRIELLVDLDENGNMVTEPFDDTASDQMTRSSRRSMPRRPEEGPAVDEEENDEEESYDEDGDEDMDDPHSLF